MLRGFMSIGVAQTDDVLTVFALDSEVLRGFMSIGVAQDDFRRTTDRFYLCFVALCLFIHR